MNSKIVVLANIAVANLALLGCASKPKPQPPKEPTMVETEHQAAARPGSTDEGDARRKRMLERAREVFQTIYFPYDQAGLDEKAKTTLAGVRAFLLEYPELTVSVEGHADERGTTEYNFALGAQRAHSVISYLGALGVHKTNLKAVSYGEEKPAREGHSEPDWKLNRRAEFVPGI